MTSSSGLHLLLSQRYQRQTAPGLARPFTSTTPGTSPRPSRHSVVSSCLSSRLWAPRALQAFLPKPRHWQKQAAACQIPRRHCHPLKPHSNRIVGCPLNTSTYFALPPTPGLQHSSLGNGNASLHLSFAIQRSWSRSLDDSSGKLYDEVEQYYQHGSSHLA